MKLVLMLVLVASFGCSPRAGRDGETDGDGDSDADTDADSDSDGDRDGGPGLIPEPPKPNPDAFFADDPPPQFCGPDGVPEDPPEVPGGTPECPDDKNREGCPCDVIGEEAACWPGLRVNRQRGICEDGTTTCIAVDEFQGAWTPCEGYVLPDEDATLGPAACQCFSEGRWDIDNLSPCFIDYGPEGIYAVSTYIGPDGQAACPEVSPPPPPEPAPGEDFSTSRLNVDCAGQFELCFTLRAGDVENPSPNDCVVARTCTEAWYEEAGEEQELPALPSWTSDDPDCAGAFSATGGYGEMSVLGLSIECEEISDGGDEYVFHRVGYCPTTCSETPDAPECQSCSQGGSGSF